MVFFKKNIIVILAFLLPILLVIGLAVSVYLPGVFLSTQYDFVYATCDGGQQYYPDYSYVNCSTYLKDLYQVENNRLVTRPVASVSGKQFPNTRLFVHDTGRNESREIDLVQAESLRLNMLITSPDGVSVDSGYNRGAEFFPFFSGSSDYGFYLSKGKKHRELNLINDGDRYYSDNNFKFIGWIINQPMK